jgi:serine phosphatase RsbU (regulator of sigma subunit)
VADVALEPGDGVLFYTDGVTDGRARTGTPFGLDRLIDLVGQMASDQLGPQEIVRLIVRRVLEHHSERLSDDATLFLVKWTGSE